MGPRGPVEQQQQRHRDADEQPGQGVEDQHPGQGGHGGEEVGPGGDAVDAAELTGRDPVEGGQGREVDQLDHGRDHHRGQGGLGQVLEQAGQEQQGDDGEGGHDQARDLRAGPGGAVDGGLGEAAVDHHAAGQAGPEVGRAQAEQLPVGVDLVVVPWPRRSWPRPGPRRSRPASPRPPPVPGPGSRPRPPPAPPAPAARCRSGRRSPRRGRPGRAATRPRSRPGRRPVSRAPSERIAAARAPGPGRPGRPAAWSRWSGRDRRAPPTAARRSSRRPPRPRTGRAAARR